MNSIFAILLGISFAAAFAIGFFTKRYLSLILSFVSGLGIAAVSFRIFLVSPSAQKAGLGIIALIPAVMIVLGVFHVFVSLLGGVIGILIGKRQKK